MEKNLSLLRGAIVAVLLSLMSGTMPLAADWNPLPDTGQTDCYDNAGNKINCPAAGQPLHGQDAQYYGPAPSYTAQTIGGDVVVTDNNSNLIWQQNTADVNGDGLITESNYPTGDWTTWQEAFDYCNGLAFGNSSNWRLPTVMELESIIDYGRSDSPFINPVFQSEPYNYWSTTIYAYHTPEVWCVHFDLGHCNVSGRSPLDYQFVRCVRDGP